MQPPVQKMTEGLAPKEYEGGAMTVSEEERTWKLHDSHRAVSAQWAGLKRHMVAESPAAASEISTWGDGGEVA